MAAQGRVRGRRLADGPVPPDRRPAACLAALFGAISIVVSRLLQRAAAHVGQGRRRTSAGSSDVTAPPERFPVRFYLIAMIFIVFDIEIIFLYPFAMIFRELGHVRPGRHRHLRCRGVRVVPVPHRQRCARLGAGQAAARTLTWSIPARTARTTVRRVGLEGRDHESLISAPIVRDQRRRAERRAGRGLMGIVDDVSRRVRRPRPQLPHRQARGPGQVGPHPQLHAGHVRPGLLRHRDDGRRRRRTTTWPASAWRPSGRRPARPTS